MRIVTLETGDASFDMHPRLTVLSGLGQEVHAAVIDAVAGLARGSPPSHASGLVEAHGVLIPVEARVLAVLDLPKGVDAVLRPTDLPGGVIAPAELHERLDRARGALAQARAAAARVRQRLDEMDATAGLAERRPELLAEVESCRAELLRADTALADARAGAIDVHLMEADVAAIETAHDQVTAAEARVGRSRLPNPVARRRLRAAEQVEREVLGRYGLPSYGAFVLRTATMHVDLEAARLLADLDARRADAEKALSEARDELARCDAALEGGGEDAVAGARAALDAATAAEHEAAATVDALAARVTDATAHPADPGAPAGDAGDTEVYVLARLAGVRAGGCAGSVPMVVDDVLVAAPPAARSRILELLDRLSATVQIVYLSDDADVAEWARSRGSARAAVVTGPGTSGPSTT